MKLSDLEKRLKDKITYTIELGVFTPEFDREESKLESNEEESKKGITNAQIMYILSLGSKVNNVDPRPVITYGINDAKKELIPYTKNKVLAMILSNKYTERAIENEIEILGNRIVSLIRDLIYDNSDSRIARNKLSTIKSKGFDHPLFNTGQLAKSITYRVKKITYLITFDKRK